MPVTITITEGYHTPQECLKGCGAAGGLAGTGFS